MRDVNGEIPGRALGNAMVIDKHTPATIVTHLVSLTVSFTDFLGNTITLKKQSKQMH